MSDSRMAFVALSALLTVVMIAGQATAYKPSKHYDVVMLSGIDALYLREDRFAVTRGGSPRSMLIP